MPDRVGTGLKARLEALRPELAAAAQAVIDGWDQDDDGWDEDFGYGGACDRVSEAMSGVVLSLDGVDVTDGGHDGDDHAWIVAYNDDEAFAVDIPPGVYETGGGYSWRKAQGAKVRPEDVEIWKVDRSHVAVFSPSLGGDGMDLATMALRVAATSVEAAKRKKKKSPPPRKPGRQSRPRKDAVPDSVLKAETEYSCRIELSIVSDFEGHADKARLLKKLKLELISAIKAGVTTTARELNLSSVGVKVSPIRLECDVNGMGDGTL